MRIVCFTLLAVSCLCYMLGKLKLEIPEVQTMANAGKGWRSPRQVVFISIFFRRYFFIENGNLFIINST